ncbi:bifunctional serine/threonine-protein kinase/formylglycine-generating enzyme family protein [Massilia sp. YIM B02763]|uniref:bifunctional serine/threonine-protein kinase/formylglycine-generating enzyme family protein n=1 Tax=Massilia sp. YIM B02763 TaxID=3050130 RepID=UPI0025B6616D|nr:bifunctional serine/threonine-protein kinase/formylglycine-generating enzyme family protein [Massilia sp. YIM B02763]MDN4056102.1 bifunctional serine/threonine-protein kinase/formylglycine-generating enzyme family protein [Massilia sp. YIM B02763]
MDKLRELRALHEDGLLSRQEFDSRKNAILDAAYAAAPSASAASSTATDPGLARSSTEIGLMAGQEVGPPNRRYRLEGLIAYGGMGQVWEATDLATHAELGHSARVALKILPPQLTEQSAWARLLVEEAARARQLAHQHIVRVYDWARDPATASYFIIMECLEGEDLDSLLAREGRLPLARALELLAPLADALDYAWDKHRLVHRDIKPANVFLAGGDVKLLDFGIAARARASTAQGMEAPATSGTAGYRAPEAGRAEGAPGRALDVYATAVMAYQMLAGAMPFADRRAAGDVPARPDGLLDAQWEALQAGFAWEAQARPASVRDWLERLLAAGDEAARRAEEQRRAAADAAARAEAARREQEETRRAELRARVQAEATAAARAAIERQRREQERLARAAAEEARQARKEELRRQLHERRAIEAEKARQEREEALRKAALAKAAAAQLAQQKRARHEAAGQDETAAPAAAAPPDDPVGAAVPVQTEGVLTEGILRDRFLDGSSKGPELVVLPTGRFQMGSPEHERKIATQAGAQKGWLARELPQHWVGIARPVAMGRYPVTVGEWRAFVQATGWAQGGDVDWEAPGFPQDARHPVVGVNWFDAVRYARWLSEATGKTYRLPSEAEWEYACRAGTKTAFSFGDAITSDQANYDGNFSYNGGPRGEYRGGTTPVGSYPANPWGLCDMHGNVWEWVQDVVHDNYEGAPADGSAWEEGGDQARRILRGGSWLYNPRYLRSALRNGFSAVLSNDIVGFRVVREL